MRTNLGPICVTALVCALSATASAQWINYATPGIPRLPDGKPNLSAPTPRTPEGKPDLSGIWRAGRTGEYGYDYNVAQTLKPEDVQPWARALRLRRVQDFRKDSPLARCLPVSVPFLNFRGMSRIVQTPGLMVVLHESPNSPHRTIFTDGRRASEESESHLAGLLGWTLGTGHAGRQFRRVQRPGLARRRRASADGDAADYRTVPAPRLRPHGARNDASRIRRPLPSRLRFARRRHWWRIPNCWRTSARTSTAIHT